MKKYEVKVTMTATIPVTASSIGDAVDRARDILWDYDREDFNVTYEIDEQ